MSRNSTEQRGNIMECARTMNILVTLNSGYIPPLKVMLASLLRHNQGWRVNVYVLHHSLTEADILAVQAVLGQRGLAESIWVEDDLLRDAPVTDRYPREMYYRIFAARYLPEHLERVLYLDPDLVVNGSLDELYQLDLGDYYFAAASHVKGSMQKINEVRLEMEEPGPYINSGVMLMNLALLRREQDYAAVFRYIESHRKVLFLPDQDLISGLYSGRILAIDPYRYNMTERLFVLRPESDAWLDLEWVQENAVIIHYCGRNKPWREPYLGKLDIFFKEAQQFLNQGQEA